MKIFIRKHWKLLSLLVILCYFFGGMLIPFAWQKETGTYEFCREEFYAEDEEGFCADRAHVVEENLEALELRLRMASEARERIILSTFDFREDESTWDLGSALYEAAERGVKVEIMVDGVSGLIRMEGKPFFYALSSHPNIEIRIYNPPNLLKPWTLNGRMHDKYVICDDKALLLGGRNTFEYFLGDYETSGKSYDREVLIYNTDYENGDKDSVLSQVKEYFYTVWEGEHMKVFHNKESLGERKKVKKAVSALKERYEEVKEHYPGAFEEFSYEESTVAVRKTTLISGETGILGKRPLVWEALQGLMAGAGERVVLHTPYAVLDSRMEEGMKEIAGKVPDFSMILNSVENGDNIVASSDYRLHKQEVIDTGVRLYEFDGGDSSHGKSILIDDDMAVIGSYNLDMRSTYMDTELMLAVHGEEFCRELEGYMDEFQKKSRRVLDVDTYETPDTVVVKAIPPVKEMLMRILGVLLQPVRYLA